MLRPVKMSRVVVAGSKDVISPVVEKLHELRLLHIVNYNGNQPEFELGKPIGKAKEYSEDLIKLRSATRYLDIKNKAPDKTYPESQVLSEMDNLLNNVGAEVTATFERITAIEAEVKSKQDQVKALTPLSVLPLPLDAYYGYDSLATFVGTAATPVDADVARVSPVNEIFTGTAKNATLVAIPYLTQSISGEVVLLCSLRHLAHVAPSMQVSASRHAHQFGDEHHRDAMALIAGESPVHGPMYVHRDIHVATEHLQGGEAGSQDINHDHIGSMIHSLLGALQDSVRAGGDIDGIKGLLARLVLHVLQGAHYRLQPWDERTEALIGKSLIVFDQVQTAANGRCGHRCCAGRVQAHFGLHNGAD